MSILFWDRENKPIEDTIEWAMKFEDVAYRVIAVDTDGPDQPMVSTIWEGLDLGHSVIPGSIPLIFETALVVDGYVTDKWLSATEEDALHNHALACREYLLRDPRPEDGHVQTIIERDKK
jgi:hypothetical protein